MPRIRSIKPEFFTDDEIAELPALTRLAFIGLWCHADREGRLKDRPRQLKALILPHDECDFEAILSALNAAHFIERYNCDGAFIQVRSFKKHQRPHHTEKPSDIPSLSSRKRRLKNGEATVNVPSSGGMEKGKEKEKGKEHGEGEGKGKGGASASGRVANGEGSPLGSDSEAPTAAVWAAYRGAYATRYGVDPTWNGSVGGQLAQFLRRVPRVEAPAIAAFYVTHPGAWYATKGHPVSALLADAEKLRTEWQTGRKVTATEARRNEQTASNAFANLAAEQRRKEQQR